MTKPVTAFTTFGSNTTGTTTQLDNNFLTLKNAVNDLNTYGNYLADTGAADALVVTLPSNITGALTNGLPIQVKVVANNSGATVINYNATGNANVVNLDGTALAANQIRANSIILLQYSSALSAWLLQTPVATKASTSTFTATGTGFTVNPTATASYSLTNNVVTLYIPVLTGTSNSVAFTVTGLPVAIRPTTAHSGFIIRATDNGTQQAAAMATVNTDGTITLSTSFLGGAWTNSGTKAAGDMTLTYNLA